MAETLEELFIDFGLNLPKLDADLRRGMAASRSAAISIEKDFYRVSQSLKLQPKVDHDPLTALNKHLDVKGQHVKRLQSDWDRKPLTPHVDTSEIARAATQIASLERSLALSASIGASVKTTVRVESRQFAAEFRAAGNDVAQTIVKRMEKGDFTVKQSGGGLFGIVGKVLGFVPFLIAQTLGDLRRGFVERVGSGAASSSVAKFTDTQVERFADYVNRVNGSLIDVETGLARFLQELTRTGNFSDAVRKGQEELVRPATNAIERLTKMQTIATLPVRNPLKELERRDKSLFDEYQKRLKAINDAAAAAVQNADPAVVAQREQRSLEQLKQNRDSGLKSLAGKTDDELAVQAKQNVKDALRVEHLQKEGIPIGAKLSKYIFDGILQELKPSDAIAALKPFLNELETPLRFIGKMQGFNAIEKARGELEGMLEILPLLTEEQKGYLLLFAGAQKQLGQGASHLQESLSGLFPGYRAVPLRNPDQDTAGNDQAKPSILMDLMAQFVPALNNQSAKDTIGNVVRQIEDAFNPMLVTNAVKQALTVIMAARERGVSDENIAALSYSLGGADLARLVQSLNLLHSDGGNPIQSVAMAYPMAGITNPNGLNNFQAFLADNDPLSFAHQLGLMNPNPSMNVVAGGEAIGVEAHAYKHLFKVPEFVEAIEKLGAKLPSDPSKFLDIAAGLFEYFGALAQGLSLLKTGKLAEDLPFKQMAWDVTPSGVISKSGELLYEAKNITPEEIASQPETYGRVAAAAKVAEEQLMQFAAILRSMGVELPDNMKATDLFDLLKSVDQKKEINRAVTELKAGVSPTDAGEASYFVGQFKPEAIRDRLMDLDNAIGYFGRFTSPKLTQVKKTFERIRAILEEFLDTGNLNQAQIAKLQTLNVGDLPAEAIDFLEGQRLKGKNIASEEEALWKVQDIEIDGVKVKPPEWAQKVRGSVVAYNKLQDALAENMPDPDEIERVAHGMSGASVLLSKEFTYKYDPDPRRLASKDEIAAYNRLQGRYSPLMAAAVPGKALVTERIQGTPLKSILDDAAKPAKAVQKKIAEVTKALESATPEETAGLERKLKQLQSAFTVVRDKFNSRAEALYFQLGQLGAALQKMGVAHMDLASGNVFLTDQGQLTSIDLGRAVVADPKTNQLSSMDKMMDEAIAIQRAVIDQAFWGILDPISITKAIHSGYSKPLPEAQPRELTTPLPQGSGAKFELGSKPETLFDMAVGNAALDDVVRQAQSLIEAKAREKTEAEEAATRLKSLAKSGEAAAAVVDTVAGGLGAVAKTVNATMDLATNAIYMGAQGLEAALIGPVPYLYALKTALSKVTGPALEPFTKKIIKGGLYGGAVVGAMHGVDPALYSQAMSVANPLVHGTVDPLVTTGLTAFAQELPHVIKHGFDLGAQVIARTPVGFMSAPMQFAGTVLNTAAYPATWAAGQAIQASAPMAGDLAANAVAPVAAAVGLGGVGTTAATSLNRVKPFVEKGVQQAIDVANQIPGFEAVSQRVAENFTELRSGAEQNLEELAIQAENLLTLIQTLSVNPELQSQAKSYIEEKLGNFQGTLLEKVTEVLDVLSRTNIEIPHAEKEAQGELIPLPQLMPKEEQRVLVDANNQPLQSGSKVSDISIADIAIDPKRFQYKLMGEHSKTGEVGSLSGVKKFDENIAGVVLTWKDPADGKVYIVNGHNRLALAQRTGQQKITARMIEAKDAQEARSIGALANIAEGQGTAIDAAKFFRDSGLTPEQLQAKGIPMRGMIAQQGVALSQLESSLFNKVVQGDLSVNRAAIIGGSGLGDAKQLALYQLIEKAAKQRKGRISDETIRELVEMVSPAAERTETQFDLFGASDQTVTDAVTRAEVTAKLKSRLSQEKRLFGVVGKSRSAEQLARAGNQIEVEASQQVSQEISAILDVFDRLKNVSGPISQAINEATAQIAAGGNVKSITDQLYEQVQAAVKSELGALAKPAPAQSAMPAKAGLSLIPLEQITALTQKLRQQYQQLQEIKLFDPQMAQRIAGEEGFNKLLADAKSLLSGKTDPKAAGQVGNIKQLLTQVSQLAVASPNVEDLTNVGQIQTVIDDLRKAFVQRATIAESDSTYAKTAAADIIAAKESADAILNELQESVRSIGKSRKTGAIQASITGLRKQIDAIHADLIAGMDTSDLGEAIGDGISEGMKQSIDGVEQVAKLVAEAPVAVIKKVLGIRSPAQETKPIGKAIIDGIIEGARNTMAAMRQFFGQVGKEAADSIDLDELNRIVRQNPPSVINPAPLPSAGEDERPAVGQRWASQIPRNVGQNSADVVSGVINNAQDAFNDSVKPLELNFLLDRVAEESKSFGEQLEKNFPIIDKAKGLIGELAQNIFALVGAYSLADAISQFGINSLQTAIDVTKLKSALNFVTSGQGERAFARLTEETNRLGGNVLAAAKGYQILGAATLGTSLERQTGQIFSAFQARGIAQGSSGEEIERTLTQVGQSIGKQNVQMEELRIIAENMPGTMQALSRALGLTTQEMYAQSQAGLLLAEEVFPKLAQQLSLESLSASADFAALPIASINRLQNKLVNLQATIGTVTLNLLQGPAEFAAKSLDFLSQNSQTVAGILQTVFLTSVVVGANALKNLFGFAVVGLLKVLGVFPTSLIPVNAQLIKMGYSANFAKAAAMGLGTTLVALKGLFALVKAMAIPALIVGTITAVKGMYDAITASSERAIRSNEQLARILERIRVGSQQPGNTSRTSQQPLASSTFGRKADDLGNALGPVGNAVLSSISPFYAVQRMIAAGSFFPNPNSRNLFGRKELNNMVEDFNKGLESIREAATNAENELKDLDLTDPFVQQLRKFDTSIAVTSVQLAEAKLLGDVTRIQELQKQIDKLQSDRGKLIEGNSGLRNLVDYENALQLAKDNLEEINQQIKDDPAKQPALQPIANFYAAEITRLTAISSKFKQVMNGNRTAAMDFARSLSLLNAKLADIQFNNDLTLQRRQTETLEQQAAGLLAPVEAQRKQKEQEQEILDDRIRALEEFNRRRDELYAKLSEQDRKALDEAIRLAGATGPESLGFLADNGEAYNLKPAQVAVLRAKQEILRSQKDVEDTRRSLASNTIELQDSAREQQSAARELVEQYRDLMQELTGQLRESKRRLQEQQAQLASERLDLQLAQIIAPGSQGMFRDLLQSMGDAAKAFQPLGDARRQLEADVDQMNAALRGNNQQAVNMQRQLGEFGRQYGVNAPLPAMTPNAQTYTPPPANRFSPTYRIDRENNDSGRGYDVPLAPGNRFQNPLPVPIRLETEGFPGRFPVFATIEGFEYQGRRIPAGSKISWFHSGRLPGANIGDVYNPGSDIAVANMEGNGGGISAGGWSVISPMFEFLQRGEAFRDKKVDSLLRWLASRQIQLLQGKGVPEQNRPTMQPSANIPANLQRFVPNNFTPSAAPTVQRPSALSNAVVPPSTFGGRLEGNQIAITLDDGPDTTSTLKWLKMLQRQGIKATFFVTGQNAKANPDLLRQIYAGGHQIGVHGFTHRRLTDMSMAEVGTELTDTVKAIQAAIPGFKPTVWRAPYGATNDAINQLAERLGLRHVGWTREGDTQDWNKNTTSAQIARQIATAKPGAIILGHDGRDVATVNGRPDANPNVRLNRDISLAGFEQGIAALKAAGRQFVTLSGNPGNPGALRPPVANNAVPFVRPQSQQPAAPTAAAGLPSIPQLPGLQNLGKALLQNQPGAFNLNDPAAIARVAIAMGIGGTEYTSAFTRPNVSMGQLAAMRGGTRNNMAGPFQINMEQHPSSRWGTPQAQMKTMAEWLSGQRRTPDSKDQADFGAELARLIQTNQITTAQQLRDWFGQRLGYDFDPAKNTAGRSWQAVSSRSSVSNGWERVGNLEEILLKWLQENINRSVTTNPTTGANPVGVAPSVDVSALTNQNTQIAQVNTESLAVQQQRITVQNERARLQVSDQMATAFNNAELAAERARLSTRGLINDYRNLTQEFTLPGFDQLAQQKDEEINARFLQLRQQLRDQRVALQNERVNAERIINSTPQTQIAALTATGLPVDQATEMVNKMRELAEAQLPQIDAQLGQIDEAMKDIGIKQKDAFNFAKAQMQLEQVNAQLSRMSNLRAENFEAQAALTIDPGMQAKLRGQAEMERARDGFRTRIQTMAQELIQLPGLSDAAQASLRNLGDAAKALNFSPEELKAFIQALPADAEQASAALNLVLSNYNLQIQAISQNANWLRGQIQDVLANSLSTLFDDLSNGTKSAGEAFRDFGRTVLQSIAQMMLRLAAMRIAMSITSALSGGGLGGGGKAGQAGGGFLGGLGRILGFNDGGEVPMMAGVKNFANGGMAESLGMAVMAAMLREGAGATPIVAHAGEQILTDRNGDAQFFRVLERSGQWQQLKQNGIGNYNDGGMVGSRVEPASPGRSRSGTGMVGTSIVIQSHDTYNVADVNDLRRSQPQRERDRAEKARRAYDKFR